MAWSAAKTCYPQINVCAARVAALDSDGTTTIGSTTMYNTNATVSVGITPVYDAGAEIKEKDGCGATFLDVIADPALIRYDIEIDFWSTDTKLLVIIIPDGVVLTGTGGVQGFGFPNPGTVTGQFAFEFWQKIINGNNLDLDYPYAHWGMTFLKNVQLQKRDVNGTAVSHTVLKAEAYANTNYFDGPGNDWTVSTAYAVLYEPVASLPTMNCTASAIAS
jgi:hypothetical protein